MITELYTKTKAVLLTVDSVRNVLIWNTNEADLIKSTPIVFIEFSPLDYQVMSGKTQECNEPRVIIHILYKTIEDGDVGLFEVSQAVFKAMAQAGFERTNERPDYSRGEMIDWQITFTAPRIVDEEAETAYITRPKPPVEVE